MTFKAFPMDSKVTEIGEDGLPVYDRAFSSADLREVYKTYFGNGYFADEGSSMNVKAASGMTLTVQAGKVHIQGVLGFMTEDATLTLSSAGTSDRVDCIVAQLNLNDDQRKVSLVVKTGTGTSVPELTRTDSVYELGLANVLVKAGVTAVCQSNITDTRLDADRCGVVEPFAKLDTASLFEQVTAIVTQAQADVEADTDKLEKATGDAVSAMNDALSSTVLGSVWRLQSSSTSDYLAYGDDLNNIASVGTKFCDSASVAGGIANKPSDVTGPFSLATFATEQDPSRLGQVLMTCDASGVKEYTRAGAGSSWTVWTSESQRAREAEESLRLSIYPDKVFLRGSSAVDDDVAYCVKFGNVVMLQIHTLTVSSSGETQFTLPEGYRPLADTSFMPVILGSESHVISRIRQNGQVVFAERGTNLTGTTVFLVA